MVTLTEATAAKVQKPEDVYESLMKSTEEVELHEGIVYQTTSYASFTNFPSNRDLDNRKVSNLVKSMNRQEGGRYLIAPILVNEELKIVDGQHRFEAVQILKLPLYFIVKVGLREEDIPLYNTNAVNWRLEDYMNAYANEGFEAYIYLKDYKERHGLFLTQAIRFLSGIRHLYETRTAGSKKQDFQYQFTSGEFEIDHSYDPTETKVKQYVEVRDLLQNRDPEKASGYINSEAFTRTMMVILSHPNYVHKDMVKSLKSKYVENGKLENIIKKLSIKRKTVLDSTMFSALSEIYNFDKRKKTTKFN